MIRQFLEWLLDLLLRLLRPVQAEDAVLLLESGGRLLTEGGGSLSLEIPS